VSAPAASTHRAQLGRAVARRAPIPAWTLTAAFGLAYVIVAPLSTDLAAAGYRSDLFSRAGFTLWDNGWYGGHHVLAYSLLAPALSALLSSQVLAALSMTAAAALFAALIDGPFAAPATRIASLWFALGAAVGLLSNRVPFELGVAVGLAALLAARVAGRARALGVLALTLAFVCALASPIAGAFLALAALAWAIDQRRLLAVAIATAALVAIAALAIAFPEGGTEPFVASAFYPVLAVLLLIAVAIPPEQRLLRVGTLLYALALIGAYVVPSAIGGNADRLGALLAGPLLVCALAGRASSRTTWALIALAPLLLYWQLRAPIADYISAASDPASKFSYYSPLLTELRRLHVGYGMRAARIEVVPTRNHMEARWVADRVAIARGWERQLDIARDGVFYGHSTTLRAARYRAWLSQNAISYVALPDAPLDYSAHGEARLIDTAPSYLRELWRSAHWRLFEVRPLTPLAQPPSVLKRLGADSFLLAAPHSGTFEVRVRFTSYWALLEGHGCVKRGPEGWTEVQARAPGTLRVGIGFSLSRVFEHGPRCR
jgi:MFS family permease